MKHQTPNTKHQTLGLVTICLVIMFYMRKLILYTVMVLVCMSLNSCWFKALGGLCACPPSNIGIGFYSRDPDFFSNNKKLKIRYTTFPFRGESSESKEPKEEELLVYSYQINNMILEVEREGASYQKDCEGYVYYGLTCDNIKHFDIKALARDTSDFSVDEGEGSLVFIVNDTREFTIKYKARRIHQNNECCPSPIIFDEISLINPQKDKVNFIKLKDKISESFYSVWKDDEKNSPQYPTVFIEL